MKKITKLTALLLIIFSCNQISEEELKIQKEKRQQAILDSLEIVEKKEIEFQHQKNIELIKTLDFVYFSDRINIYEAMNAISGVEGKTDWEISYPDEYKDNPNLCVVEGTAKSSKKKKEVYINLLLNKETGQFEIKKAIENGKKIGSMELMMLFVFSGAGIN